MALSAADKIEIQELSSRYAMAMDDKDEQSWLETWIDAGEWEGAIGKFSRRAGLEEVLKKLGERLQGKRHVMTNFVVDGDGDAATQRCYLLIVDSSKQMPPGIAVYNDELKKVNCKWRFARRTVKID